MPYAKAVIRIDHQHAQIIGFDDDGFEASSLAAHVHDTRQHHSDVRTEHEFLANVCSALTGMDEILVTGPHTGISAFRHYVEKHRPALNPYIVGWEVVDHPSQGQLLAFARQYLSTLGRMAAPSA
jgi:stalled ribosome rescue protein Dom34